MGEKRTRRAHLLGLACPLLNPLLGLVPGLVEREEASLSTALDELIGLGDEFCREDPAGDLSVGGNGVRRRVPGDLRNLGRRVDELGLDLRGGVDRGRTLEPVRENELSVVFTDSL